MDRARVCRGGGLQGCFRDEQRNNWCCARAVRKRPHPPPHPPARSQPVCQLLQRGPRWGLWTHPRALLKKNAAPLGGAVWGFPHPLDPSCPFKDGAKFSSGPLANHKLFLGPSAPISLDQNFSSAPQKLGTAGGGGGANAETTPAGAPAAAADRTQRPDATCEGKTG